MSKTNITYESFENAGLNLSDNYKVGMKRGGAAMDVESRDALRATKAKTDNYVVKHRRSGEKSKFESKSIARGGGAGAMSNRMLTNIMCPIFSYKRVGFGNSWSKRAWDHLQSTVPSRQGTVKSLSWASNTQAWNEFIGLPLHNWGSKDGTGATAQYFTYDGFTASISELIAKAADVRNDVQSTYFSRPTGTLDMINTTEDALSGTRNINWNGLVFDYHGGYQEHTFVNCSECNVTIFLQECKPRSVMTGVEEDLAAAGIQYKVRSIGEDLLIDYRNDLPLGNTLNPIFSADGAGNNNSTNEISDVMVKINKHSNLVHRKYLVGKELRVTLKPGDSYTHRMSFDPFHFNESTFNSLASQLTDRTSTTAQTSSTPPIMMVPLFTKILVVRAKSELGFEATSGAISNVGTLPGAISHLCTEKHTCRMLPAQKPYQSFVDYTLTGLVNQNMEGQTDGDVDILASGGLATA